MKRNLHIHVVNSLKATNVPSLSPKLSFYVFLTVPYCLTVGGFDAAGTTHKYKEKHQCYIHVHVQTYKLYTSGIFMTHIGPSL